MKSQIRVGTLTLVVGALCAWSIAYDAGAADFPAASGQNDWMIPPCERPISEAYPARPAECADGKPAPRDPAQVQPRGQAPAVPAAQPIRVAANAKAKSIKLLRVRTSIREGDRVGEIRYGTFCNSNAQINMSARIQSALLAPLVKPVRDEFTRAGYADPVGQRGLFEEESDQSSVDYQLGALIEEFNASYCRRGTALVAGLEGQVRAKVRWQLFDPVARKVVYTKVTESNYQTAGSEAIREPDFFNRVYAQGVREMLADPSFYALAVESAQLAHGAAPDPATPTGNSAIVVKRAPPFTGSLASNMTNVRAAVVTVSQGAGSGSGFFVGENGYVMTNSHVVGGNRFVRVKLATGRELVGEVVKQDTGRDVALIKTEGNKFMVLPVSPGEANVGGEVTAIGSPLGEALSGTVTRGIVSAYRVIDGKRYIQSDVSILPGNSGGPLLDNSGRVIGIAVMQRSGASGRINFFVPIQEALDKLDLRVSD